MLQKSLKFTSVTALLAVLAGGCVLGNGAKSTTLEASGTPPGNADAGGSPADAAKAPAAKTLPKARVAAKWQSQMLTQLTAQKGGEAYGLFSSGGWADAGQVMVITQTPGATNNIAAGAARLQVVDSGRQTVTNETPLTAAQLAAFVAQLGGSDKLADVNMQVFDGLIFEYVHAVMSSTEAGATPSIVGRVYIRAGTELAPAYTQLLASFRALHPAAAPK